VLVATWGYCPTRTWRRRWVLVSAFGFRDEQRLTGYFFSAVVLAFGLPRGILFNARWYPAVDRRRFAQWWALGASLAVGLMLFYIAMFHRSGQLGNLLTQGVHRLPAATCLWTPLASRAD
jgi:hypothetical protein